MDGKPANNQIDQLLLFLNDDNWQAGLEIGQEAAGSLLEGRPVPMLCHELAAGVGYIPAPLWYSRGGTKTPFQAIADQLSVSIAKSAIKIAEGEDPKAISRVLDATNASKYPPPYNTAITKLKNGDGSFIASIRDSLADLEESEQITFVAMIGGALLKAIPEESRSEVAKNTPSTFDTQANFGYEAASLRANEGSLINSQTIPDVDPSLLLSRGALPEIPHR